MALWVTDKKLDRFLSEAKKFHYSKTIHLPGRVAMAIKVTREKSTQPNQTWHRTYSGKDAAPLFKPKHSEDSCFCFKPQLNRNLPKFYNSGSNSNKTPSQWFFFKFQASNLWQEIQKCKLSAWIVVLSNSLSGMENPRRQRLKRDSEIKSLAGRSFDQPTQQSLLPYFSRQSSWLS